MVQTVDCGNLCTGSVGHTALREPVPGCASAWPQVHPAWGSHLRATGLGFEWQLKIDPVWSDFSV